jgi:hypothetical protein
MMAGWKRRAFGPPFFLPICLDVWLICTSPRENSVLGNADFSEESLKGKPGAPIYGMTVWLCATDPSIL